MQTLTWCDGVRGLFFSFLSFFLFFFSCSCLKPPYPGHLACFSPGGGRRGCVHRPGAPLSSGWLQRLLGTKSLAAGRCAHRAALGRHSHVGKNTQNYEVQRCVHLRRSLRRDLLGLCDLSAPLHPSLLRALLQAPAVASVRCCRNALPVFPGCSVELGSWDGADARPRWGWTRAAGSRAAAGWRAFQQEATWQRDKHEPGSCDYMLGEYLAADAK